MIANKNTNFSDDKVFVDSAKSLLNDANYWMEKGIKKELPPSEINNHIKPLMAKYFEVYKKLSPKDTAVVKQYRIDKVNELVDLQMKVSQKQ